MLKEAILALCLTAPTAIDGDTWRQCGISVRLDDYDAPELFHPKCPREYSIAQLAKTELEKRLPTIKYTIVPCATSNYGRLCAHVDGLAADMIGKGLASKFRQSWC